jgi:hypothetical protein
MQQETFDPTIRSWHSKIDLPTPNPCALYCIRKIENRPELGYCYLTVLVEREGIPESEPYETTLFYTYAPIQGYSRFIEDIKGLVPLHCARIKDYLVTFHRTEVCSCGWECERKPNERL